MSSNNNTQVNSSDPSVARQEQREADALLQRSRLSSAPSLSGSTNNASFATGSQIVRTLAPVSDGSAVLFPQSTTITSVDTVTINSSINNDTGDLTTVYSTNGEIIVTPINQTINQYVAADSGVNQILAGRGIIVTSTGLSGTGIVTINANTASFGNIVYVNLDGNAANVLHGDGSWSADQTTYSNSNVVSLMAAFGSNTITTTGNVSVGNIIGNGQALTGIAGANVLGFVPNANVANTALAVAAANVSGLGNIATINLDGNVSNILTGAGTFVAIPTGGANANYANFAGNAFSVDGGNVVGSVANANYAANAGIANSATVANSANSVTLANVNGAGNIASINLDGNVSNILTGAGTFVAIPTGGANANYANFAGNAFSVDGTNVSGTVANATFALNAGNANIANIANTSNSANSVTLANVVGAGNIASINLDGNVSNILTGAGTFVAIPTGGANANYANFAGNAFSVDGANVSGTVANATFALNAGNTNFANSATIANSANSVTLANVSGAGNIASINLDGNVSNILTGAGTFVTIPTGGANANYANFAGNVTIASQPNITSVGTLTDLIVGNTTANTVFGNGTITATGNVTAANLIGNIVSANLIRLPAIGDNNAVLFNRNNEISASIGMTFDTANSLFVVGNISGNTLLAQAGVYVVANGAGVVEAPFLSSSVDPGFAPIRVRSSTLVPNLYVARANVADTVNVTAGTGNNFLVFANTATGNVSQVTSTGITADLLNNSITANTFIGNLVGNFVVPGANGEILFNSSNRAEANNALSFNNTTKVLNVNGNITSSGNLSVTANVAAGNLTTTGSITGLIATSNQSSITQVGTLLNLNVNGAINAASLATQADVYAVGQATVVSAGFLEARVETGFAPLRINSTTLVPNLYVARANVADSVTLANVSGVGNIASINLDGNVSNLLTGAGTFVAIPTVSSNANYANFAGTAFSVDGANVSGTVANATYAANAGNANFANSATTANTANSANSVTLANVSGAGNIASINLDGNVSNILTGAGTFVAIPTVSSNANYANFAGTAFSVDGANVSGTVANANSAAFLGTEAAANYLLATGTGSSLTSITGANVTGQVGNALVAGTVYTNAQPNITSVGTLTSLAVTGNSSAGNIITNAIVGSTTGVTITAAGTNQNINLVPTGTGTVNIGNFIISNVATPTSDFDAATKKYVDDIAQGLNIHDACYAATTNNLAALTAGIISYDNGAAGVGATLTLSGSPTKDFLDNGTFDAGATAIVGSRILVKNQTDAAQNGIYVVTSIDVLTRAADYNSVPEVEAGDFTFVSYGDTYANTGWVQTSTVVVIGINPILFTQFSGAGTYSAGTGLNLIGTVFSIANTTVVPASYGSGDYVATFTVNEQGQLTAASNTAITANAANLTGTTLASGITTSSLTSVGTLGNLAVTDNVTAGNANVTGQLISTIATGTAPLVVTSTTQVANLNAATAGLATFATTANAVAGANVSGTVANATFALDAGNANFANSATVASSANSVTLANVSGAGNIASINLDGNVSNILTGAGTFVAIPTNVANANYANFAGNAFSVDGANVSGTVANATFALNAGNANIANIAYSVAGANVSGTVANATFALDAGNANIANIAYSVAGANVSGTVANATFALDAGNANIANSATVANSANSVTLANVSGAGNIASINLDGNVSNILTGNGTFVAIPTNVANANYANFAGNAFSVDGANVSGTVANATFALNAGNANIANSATNANTANIANIAYSVDGANVSGTVANATYAANAGNANFANTATVANSANSVTLANVSGAGNIASINLTGSNSNVLYGNGVFAPEGTSGNANYANFAGTAFSVDGANVSGTVANATYAVNAGNANFANSATTANSANTANTANIANIAYSVDGANVSGTVANATYAANAGNANFANSATNANTANIANIAYSVDGANVSGTVANATYALNAGNANFANSATSANTANTANIANIANVAYSVDGANVSGTVANATYAANAGNANIANSATVANSANSVTLANVSGAGNIASINLTGSNSDVLYGNGVFAPEGTSGNANYANFAGTVLTNAQPNITSVGTLTDLNVSGNGIFGGNLTVNGNLVYVNVDTLAIKDPIIQLQSGPNGAPPIANSGKDVGTALNYYDTEARVAFMGWDVSNVEFGLASQSDITNEVVTFTSYGNLRVGNIIGNGQALTALTGANVTGTVANATFALNAGNANIANIAYSVAGANVSGTVANATFALDAGNANIANSATVANSANSVTLANVSGAGNIASINLDGNVSNLLTGNGTFVAIPTNVANANYANFAGNAFSVDGANVSGTVANATFALDAGNANIANIANSATIANSANSVNIANVAGLVFDTFTIYVGENGNDTTGNGTVINPYKTISKAVDTVGQGGVIIVSPGEYNEDVTINNKFAITISSETPGGRQAFTPAIYGNLTISGNSSSISFKGIGVQKGISHTSTGTVYMSEFQVGSGNVVGQLSKTGNGTLSMQNVSLDRVSGGNITPVTISGPGTVLFSNVALGLLSVNNTSATVNMLSDSSSLQANISAGSLNVFDSILYTLANSGSNAIVGTGGVINVRNSIAINPNQTTARLNVGPSTVLAYDDFYFDRPNSNVGINPNITIDFQSIRLANTLTANFVAGTLTTATQPNITSVGTLGNLAVTGNVTAGNANLGNLATANFLSGTLTTAAQPNITSVGTLTSLGVNGNITCNSLGSFGQVHIGGNLSYQDTANLIVVENKDSFADIIAQNKNSGGNASMNIVLINDNPGNVYMAVGVNSSNFTPFYNTLFEIPNAGYVSHTTTQVMGPQSSESGNSRMYFTYSSGSYALELNEHGAIGWGASYNGNLTQGNFGNVGQVLTSAGENSAPTWNNITGIANGNSNVSIATANGNVTVAANASSWTFGTDGNLTLPTISLGGNLNEQTVIRSQRKIIPPAHWSAEINGSTPTVVYTANASTQTLKSTFVVQHDIGGFEMFDVAAIKAGANTVYTVSNRLNTTDQDYTNVVVDSVGNALSVTLTVNSGANTSWVTYDSTEFGIANI